MTLLTQNISKSGICFPAPRRIEPGQFVEVEVTLLDVGPGGNNVYISAEGYIVRAEEGNTPGWYRLAAAFGDQPSSDEPDWHKLIASFDEPPQ